MKFGIANCIIAALVATGLWGNAHASPKILIPLPAEKAYGMPHFDPLRMDDSDKGKLNIYDEGLQSSFEKFPDWRDVDTTGAGRYLERSLRTYYDKAENGAFIDDEGKEKWDGRSLNRCDRYFATDLSDQPGREISVSDDIANWSFCYARIALAALGAEDFERDLHNSFHNVTILEELFKHLPMANFRVSLGSQETELSEQLGLPEGSKVTWPAGRFAGDNVVRVEQTLFSADEPGALEEVGGAVRIGNGYICYANKPCLCRFSANCMEYVVGLLAAWIDEENTTHWLLYSASRIDFTQGMGWQRRDFSILYHVIGKAGEKPKIDQKFADKLRKFAEENLGKN